VLSYAIRWTFSPRRSSTAALLFQEKIDPGIAAIFDLPSQHAIAAKLGIAPAAIAARPADWVAGVDPTSSYRSRDRLPPVPTNRAAFGSIVRFGEPYWCRGGETVMAPGLAT